LTTATFETKSEIWMPMTSAIRRAHSGPPGAHWSGGASPLATASA